MEAQNNSTLIYNNYKFTHNGILTYKTFEGNTRNMHKNCLKNLLSYKDEDENKNQQFKLKRNEIFSQAMSKRVYTQCCKLTHYSPTRTFSNQRKQFFSMKVAFLTLGAPENYTIEEINNAFQHFLDYLSRTAQATFIYKKEIGFKSGLFHIHLMINNFIPYYIISWKWKSLLIKENTNWPKKENGKDYNAHSRIELPKSKKMVAAYIGKYIAKECKVIGNIGKIWGQSKCLSEIKEPIYTDGDLPEKELIEISKISKVKETDYCYYMIFEWKKIQKIAKTIFLEYINHFKEISEQITQPQRFNLTYQIS